jgi:hypothetical protein
MRMIPTQGGRCQFKIFLTASEAKVVPAAGQTHLSAPLALENWLSRAETSCEHEAVLVAG